jgi:ribosome-associated protein
VPGRHGNAGHVKLKPKGKGTLSPTATSRAAARRAADTSSKRTDDSSGSVANTTLSVVLDRLDDIKAEDTVSVDLTGKTSIADLMVITSGRSHRHVAAIADRVVEGLKKSGIENIHVEGMPNCDWVLVDAGDLIVHIFRPEVRAFYNLEKMWAGTARSRRVS